MQSPETDAETNGTENGGWTRVIHKKGEGEEEIEVASSQAVAISNKGKLSCAKILKKVKAELNDLAGNVNKICRIQRDDLMFKLK